MKNFKGSLQRENFNLQDNGTFSYEKNFPTFLRAFEFIQFSRKRWPHFLTLCNSEAANWRLACPCPYFSDRRSGRDSDQESRGK